MTELPLSDVGTPGKREKPAHPTNALIFKSALQEMTFSDAKQILRGGDTAATDFFRTTSSERLSAAFLPIVASSLN